MDLNNDGTEAMFISYWASKVTLIFSHLEEYVKIIRSTPNVLAA